MAHTQVVAGLNYRLVLSVKDKAKKHFNLEAVVFQVERAGTAGGSRYRPALQGLGAAEGQGQRGNSRPLVLA